MRRAETGTGVLHYGTTVLPLLFDTTFIFTLGVLPGAIATFFVLHRPARLILPRGPRRIRVLSHNRSPYVRGTNVCVHGQSKNW